MSFIVFFHYDSAEASALVMPIIGAMCLVFTAYAGVASYSYGKFISTVKDAAATTTDETEPQPEAKL